VSGAINLFNYVVVTMTNIPNISPTVVNIINPVIITSHTVIVLIRNGLSIEKLVFEAFPRNIMISGISKMSSAELKHGKVLH
jgi:ketopantoate reductase